MPKGGYSESATEPAHNIGLGNGMLGNGHDWEEKRRESRVSEQQMELEKGLEASCQSAVKVECNMTFSPLCPKSLTPNA